MALTNFNYHLVDDHLAHDRVEEACEHFTYFFNSLEDDSLFSDLKNDVVLQQANLARLENRDIRGISEHDQTAERNKIINNLLNISSKVKQKINDLQTTQLFSQPIQNNEDSDVSDQLLFVQEAIRSLRRNNLIAPIEGFLHSLENNLDTIRENAKKHQIDKSKKIEESRNQIEQLDKEKESYKLKAVDLETELNQEKENKKKDENTLKNIQKEKEKLQRQLNLVTSTQQVNLLEIQADNQKQIDKLKAQLTLERITLEKHKREYEQYRSNETNQTNELKQLREDLDQEQKLLAEHKKQLKKLEDQNKEYSKVLEMKDSDVEKLKETIENKNNQIQNLKDKIASEINLIDNTSEQYSVTTEKYEQTQKDYNEAIEQLEFLRISKQKSDSAINAIRKELLTAKSELSDLKNNKIKDYEKKIAYLKTQVGRGNSQEDQALIRRIQTLTKERDHAKNEKSIFEKKSNDYEIKIEKINQQLKRIKDDDQERFLFFMWPWGWAAAGVLLTLFIFFAFQLASSIQDINDLQRNLNHEKARTKNLQRKDSLWNKKYNFLVEKDSCKTLSEEDSIALGLKIVPESITHSEKIKKISDITKNKETSKKSETVDSNTNSPRTKQPNVKVVLLPFCAGDTSINNAEQQEIKKLFNTVKQELANKIGKSIHFYALEDINKCKVKPSDLLKTEDTHYIETRIFEEAQNRKIIIDLHDAHAKANTKTSILSVPLVFRVSQRKYQEKVGEIVEQLHKAIQANILQPN